MNNSTKIAVAVVGGYVLGRRRKARLALVLGSWLVGKRLNLDPRSLGRDALRQLAANPEVAKLGNSVRTELLQAARGAATTALTSRMEGLSDRLHDRTAALSGMSDAAGSRGEEGDTAARRGEEGDEDGQRAGRDDEEREGPEETGTDDGTTGTRASGRRKSATRPTRKSAARSAPRRTAERSAPQRRGSTASRESARQSERPSRPARPARSRRSDRDAGGS